MNNLAKAISLFLQRYFVRSESTKMLSTFCKIVLIVNFMLTNDRMILAISKNLSLVWEYEDFVLERYRQYFIKPLKVLI